MSERAPLGWELFLFAAVLANGVTALLCGLVFEHWAQGAFFLVLSTWLLAVDNKTRGA